MSRAISPIPPRHVLSGRLPARSAAARVALLPPGTHRRHNHSVSAAEAARQMWDHFKDKKHVREQVLDGNQLQKLSHTLGWRALYQARTAWPNEVTGGVDLLPDLRHDRRTADLELGPPSQFTAIPQGYHLAYFTPDGVESDLGPDGTDVSWNAPAPFTRRMWAGGRMRWETREPGSYWQDIWHGENHARVQDVKLVVGDRVKETTTLVSATPKVGKDGTEMVLVEVKKEFETSRGLALVDQRSWIFRPEATVPSPAAKKKLSDAVVKGPTTMKDIYPEDEYFNVSSIRRELRWSPTSLFRFSALTFNGHKIHYDPAWTAAVEGHSACVVHGPLNLICMLDFWRDHCASVDETPAVREISYRALAPIYAGETYSISAENTGNKKWEVRVIKDGTTCMTGHIVGFHWYLDGILGKRRDFNEGSRRSRRSMLARARARGRV